MPSGSFVSQKLQLVSVSMWLEAALCGHTLPSLTDSLIHAVTQQATVYGKRGRLSW